jgi:hypothetical protein
MMNEVPMKGFVIHSSFAIDSLRSPFRLLSVVCLASLGSGFVIFSLPSRAEAHDYFSPSPATGSS